MTAMKIRGIEKNPWYYLSLKEEQENEDDLSFISLPVELQTRILKKFSGFYELATMEGTCKIMRDTVSEMGYIFRAVRVAVDESTEYIVIPGNEFERIDSFTNSRARIICEDLDISYEDPLLIMDNSRIKEVIEAIEANGLRSKRLTINIPFTSKNLFTRLLTAIRPKSLMVRAKLEPEFLLNDYIYKEIEQLYITEEIDMAEEDILQFKGKELTIMNGALSPDGLLQIADEFIQSKREINVIQIRFKDGFSASQEELRLLAQFLVEDSTSQNNNNSLCVRNLVSGSEIQIVIEEKCITFSEPNRFW